jgi:hypothetical protein
MRDELNWRMVLVAAVSVVAVGIAVLSTRHYAGGPPRSFQQRPVPQEVLRAIESTTQELLALAPEPRAARLRELASPRATPGTLKGLAAQLDEMARAVSCTLTVANGYGPSIVKAIYELSARDAPPKRVGLFFERRDGGVAVLDVAR